MDAILWQEQALSLLDQTKYPGEEHWTQCHDSRAVAAVLASGVVRGENLRAIAGAYGYCLAALEQQDAERAALLTALAVAHAELLAACPASAALAAALTRMEATQTEYADSPELITALLAEAVTIHRQDVIKCRAMNRNGAQILPESGRVVALCQNGIFHSGSYGGALGTVRAAYRKGKVEQLFLCEGRPARADGFARELAAGGIPVTLIPDHGAATLMARHSADVILLEGISVAENGDLLALSGAYELAIAAYFHSIQVYATVFFSDVSWDLPDGSSFPDDVAEPEIRAALTDGLDLPEAVATWSSKYDMVPQYLLTGLITDKGLIYPDFRENLAASNSPDKAASLL